MNTEEMNDSQVYEMYDRSREKMEQLAKIVLKQPKGPARSANEKERDKLWMLCCDLKWEMCQRI